MKQLFFLILLALPTSAETLRIGAIASLTGAAGEQGKSWVQGAELAVDDLRAEGKDVALFVEDDATSPAKGATAFQKLRSANQVKAIIGGTWDYLTEALSPLSRQAKLPLISPSNPPELFSGNKNPYLFVNGLSLAAEAEALRGFLQKKGPKSVAIISVQVPFCVAHAEMIRKLSAELGIQVAYETELPLEGYKDGLKVAALRVAQLKPDLVYAPIEYSALDLLQGELEKNEVFPMMLTAQHLDKAYELSKNLERYRKSYGVFPDYAREPFDSQFRARFGSAPGVFAAAGYDALRFAVMTAENGLRESALPGISGPMFLPPQGKSVQATKAVIMGFESGSLAPVQ